HTTFDELFNTIKHIHPGATIIGLISLLVLILWDKVLSSKGRVFQLIQGPLVVVVLGIVFYSLTLNNNTLSIGNGHLVNVPVPGNISDFLGQFSFPNFEVITNYKVWVTAFTIAVVASIETLLSVEATDKLDPEKNITPTN